MSARLPCLLLSALLALPAATWATAGPEGADGGARLSICYNYGCASEGSVHVRGPTLRRIGERLAGAVGGLYRVAATQTAVAADRAGNLLDGGADGRMDCIDHSTSTTRLLQLLEARGALRFHRVVEPARRTRLILQHFSAVIEVLSVAERIDRLPPGQALAGCNCTEDGLVIGGIGEADGDDRPGQRYVVDSWFVDNGEPAVVLPLAEWLNGGGPNVQ